MAKYYGYCYDEEGRFTEMIPLEYSLDEEAGEEVPLLPPQCTLQQPPDGIYYPLWTSSKWIKTVEVPTPPPEPPTPSELDAIKAELEKVKQELEELKNKSKEVDTNESI
ncbi:TPA: hypothetical protein ACSVZR_003518 [Bacillus cereus]